MPIASVPFEHIGVDLVGPLILSLGRHRFILVVIDYSTRYSEAMPLRTAKAAVVAQELAMLFYHGRVTQTDCDGPRDSSSWGKCSRFSTS